MFKNEEGFSLLELVVAVGVAGIIAAVALPTFAGIQDKASQTSATYAASASAAEALANSTMGLTGSASSNTGASSSSSSAPVNTTISITSADFLNDQYGQAGYVADFGANGLTFSQLSQAKVDAIVAKLSASATPVNVTIEIGGATPHIRTYSVSNTGYNVTTSYGKPVIYMEYLSVNTGGGDSWFLGRVDSYPATITIN